MTHDPEILYVIFFKVSVSMLIEDINQFPSTRMKSFMEILANTHLKSFGATKQPFENTRDYLNEGYNQTFFLILLFKIRDYRLIFYNGLFDSLKIVIL